MYQAKIIDVRRRRPNHIIELMVYSGSGGGSETTQVNPRGLEMLLKYFRVQKPSELIGKTFDTELFYPINVLKAFFRYNYPADKELVVTVFKPKPKKYDPMKWAIDCVHSKHKYLVIGPKEEEYRVVDLKGCHPGRHWEIFGPVHLREKSQKILMSHFGVSKLEELVGKEFRANVSDPEGALYALIAKIVDPDLI